MVGSLLKPKDLQRLFAEVFAGISAQEQFVPADRLERLDELHERAARAAREVIARQLEVGLDVVGDGEMSRAYFLNSFYGAVDGLKSRPPGGDPFFGHEPLVANHLRKVANPLARELSFLRSVTDHPVKASLPAPSIYHMAGYDVAQDAYPDTDAYVDDVARIERELVEEAAAAGATYVQFDLPIYTMLAGDNARQVVAGDLDHVLDHALQADAAAVAGLPDSLTTAIHMCRGNSDQGGIVKGGLDPIAERLFDELPHDRFLVEWHDQTVAGDFGALRFVPKGKVVVMGLVSTQTARLETTDELLQRMDDAQRFLPIDQLAISPQCGFSSFFAGNESARDVMWRKLELVAEVADRIWPR
jgi:5-methyltetrahydropteroyltriglutamate--homocysteine methyltransferase